MREESGASQLEALEMEDFFPKRKGTDMAETETPDLRNTHREPPPVQDLHDQRGISPDRVAEIIKTISPEGRVRFQVRR